MKSRGDVGRGRAQLRYEIRSQQRLLNIVYHRLPPALLTARRHKSGGRAKQRQVPPYTRGRVSLLYASAGGASAVAPSVGSLRHIPSIRAVRLCSSGRRRRRVRFAGRHTSYALTGARLRAQGWDDNITMAQSEDGTAPHQILNDAATHLELNELKGLVHAHTEELKTGPDTRRSPFQLNFRGLRRPS